MNSEIPKKCYFNRELSWLQFNRRVLAQAMFCDTPLFEKLRFLSIFSTNLDEFFMVRVGSLLDQSLIKKTLIDNKTGMTASEQLAAIYREMPALYRERDDAAARVEAELAAAGFARVRMPELDAAEKRGVRAWFSRQVLPLLSPVLVDSRHPFPHLENQRSYLAARIKTQSGSQYGLVLIKKILDPVFFLPDGRYILLEDLFLKYASSIFKGLKLEQKCIVRVTRNADLEIAEGLYDEETDYRSFMKKLLKIRPKLSPTRLEIQGAHCKAVESWLTDRLGLMRHQVLKSRCPLDFSYSKAFEGRLGTDAKFAPLRPKWPAELAKRESILVQVARRDVLLKLPFHSMRPLLSMLEEAAHSPDTVSIKICLYRLASDSQVVQSLCTAADNGVDVTVVLELRARFDERNNIDWATRLEEAGCTVLYGVDDYKIHSKIALITQKHGEEISYFTHIGTGNYNESTARQYTDLGLLTANRAIGEDAARLFQNLSLSNVHESYRTLVAAPEQLKDKLLAHIFDETQKARLGKPCGIGLKMNSLTDKDLCDALVEASRAGVPVDMLVRGICCLAPGIPSFSENIRIHSIVGRFLEHSRIFLFGAPPQRKVYISSADWMTRNTERRVELACPILDRELADQLADMFALMMADNHRTWVLQSDGSYEKIEAAAPVLDSQTRLYELTAGR